MPAQVPTSEEFNALTARVTALEQGATQPPVVPPIVPPDPGVDPRAKVLSMLRVNTGKAWVCAQMCHADLAEHNWNKSKGINAAMIMMDPCMDMQPESSWNNSGVNDLISHGQSGGLVGVSLFIPNPITHGGSTDRGNINPLAMITPGTSQYDAYVRLCDRAIAYMKPIDDAGIPVLHRYLWEAEGNWFWWNCVNGGMFTIDQYKELFDIWTKRVRAALKHVICCWATNGNSVNHYPRASKPELVGFDGYTNNPSSYKSHYDALIQIAPDALYNFAEFGSGNPAQGDSNYDCQNFVDTMRVVMPKLCMAMAWSGGNNNGWAWGNYRNPQALNTASVLQWGELWA